MFASRFRYLLPRVFKVWFYLLNCRANKYMAKIEPKRSARLSYPEFLKKNESLQSELHQFFVHLYHFCPSCGECCLHHVPPRYAVDYILLGNPNHQYFRASQFRLKKICQGAAYFLNRTISFKLPTKEDVLEEDSTRVPCPELRDSGCRIPWGQRYVNCVIYICPNFCQEMTWQEFWKYMYLSSNYMLYIHIFTNKVISRYRRVLK